MADETHDKFETFGLPQGALEQAMHDSVMVDSKDAAPTTNGNGAGHGDAPLRLLDITRDEVFAADDMRVIEVPVDEWKQGGIVYVHTPSAADKDYLEQVLLAGVDGDGNPKRIGKDEVRAHFVAMCARNSKGERIFTVEDVPKLKRKNVAPMDRIYGAILDASVITERDVTVMAKNSGTASSGT